MLSVLGLMAVAGCAAERAETLSADQRPRAETTVSSTVFTEAMRCLDGLLARRNAPTTDIVVGSMPDASGKLPVSLRDMTIHSVTRATQRSRAYKVIDITSIPFAQLNQTTGQPFPVTPTVNLAPTSLNLTGSIVNASQALYNESAGVGFQTPVGGAGISYVGQLGSLETSMRVSRFGTHEVLYSSQQQITLRQSQFGVDGRAGYSEYGASVGFSFDKQDSPAKAVQTLVDLHVIELLGKHANVPYWTCLSRGDTAPKFHQAASAQWRDQDEAGRDRFMRASLSKLGYHGSFEQQLQQFQLDNGLTPTARSTYETYLAIKAQIEGSAATTLATAESETTTPPISVRATNIGPTWRLEVGLARSAFVNCYYRADDGVIAQIYPNRFAPRRWISASTPLSVPDTISEKSFLIQGVQPSFMCLASPDDPLSRLPDGLQQPPFSDLTAAGYRDLRAVEAGYRQSGIKGLSVAYAR